MAFLSEGRYIKMFETVKESVLPFVFLMMFFIFIIWLIIKPIVSPLMWSAILSYLAYPIYRYVYKKLLGGQHPNIAAGITTASIVFLMCIPMLLLSFFLVKEAVGIYRVVVESGVLSCSYSDLLLRVKEIPFIYRLIGGLDVSVDIPFIDSVLGSAARWLTSSVSHLSSSIIGNTFQIFYLLVIVAITSFFIVRDGHMILCYVQDILPIPREYRSKLMDKSAGILRAVFYGIIVTAGIQGFLGGLGWWFVGLSHPLFFGFLMFIGGMIPFVGTLIVWIPGSLVLLASGNIRGGVLLLIWGFGIVSMIDNFIRPVFISEESKIHMLLVFVGLFGGLFNWGFVGLFIGPLVVSLGIFLLDIYREIVTGKIVVEDGDES